MPHAREIPDRGYEQFAIYILSHLTKEQLATLTPIEYKTCMDLSKLKTYVRTRPQSAIDIMLAKAGVEHLRVYYTKDKEESLDEAIFSTYNALEFPQKKSDLIEAMRGNRVYVTGNRYTMAALMFMSSLTNSIAYKLSMAAQNFATTLGMVKKKSHGLSESTHDSIDNASAAYQEVNRLIISAYRGHYLSDVYSIPMEQMAVLCVLYTKSLEHQRFDHISSLSSVTPAKLSKALAELEREGYVVSDATREKEKNERKNNYLLTGNGVKIVMEYIQHVYNFTFNHKQ